MRRLSISLAALVLAWLCAQQPQGLVVGVLAWLRSSTRFSHQEELVRSLRVSLAQATQPAAEPDRLAEHEREPAPPTPTVPMPSVALEKVQLALVETLEVGPPAGVRLGVDRENDSFMPRGREVPVPVPRRVDVSVTA